MSREPSSGQMRHAQAHGGWDGGPQPEAPPSEPPRASQRRRNFKIVVEPAKPKPPPPEARAEYNEVTSITAGTYLYDLARDPAERTNLFAPGDPATEELLARYG